LKPVWGGSLAAKIRRLIKNWSSELKRPGYKGAINSVKKFS
jgi:hypothetical protein